MFAPVARDSAQLTKRRSGSTEFTLHHVKDTAATGDDPTYFRPLEDLIEFDGQQNSSKEIHRYVALHELADEVGGLTI